MTAKPSTHPTFAQMGHFFRLASDGLVTTEMFQGFLEQPDRFVRPTSPVTISYQVGLVEMIKLGKYDWTNEDINPKNFPLEGTGEVNVELVLVHIGENVSSDEARARIIDQELGISPIEHLLMFGAKNPELQRKFPIVALGSVMVFADGYRCVPFLGGSAGGRGLGLSGEGGGWDDGCRFLAFRK